MRYYQFIFFTQAFYRAYSNPPCWTSPWLLFPLGKLPLTLGVLRACLFC